MNQPQINSILKAIAEQEKKLTEAQEKITESSADAEASKIQISALKKALEKEDLSSELNVLTSQNEIKQLSKEITYRFICESSKPIQIKDIVQLYDQLGLKKVDQRKIDSQLKALISEGYVIQTNPEQKRSRLFFRK